MILSKKEISIIIELVFSLLFAVIFLPYFYENRLSSFDFTENIFVWLISGKIGQMIIFSILYYSIAYIILELTFKEKIISDERDDMINSKSYKLGFLLYEFSLFIFISDLIHINPLDSFQWFS